MLIYCTQIVTCTPRNTNAKRRLHIAHARIRCSNIEHWGLKGDTGEPGAHNIRSLSWNRRLVLDPPITDVDCVEHSFKIWKLQQEDDKCGQKFCLCFRDVSVKTVHFLACLVLYILYILIVVCIEVEMRQVPHIT